MDILTDILMQTLQGLKTNLYDDSRQDFSNTHGCSECDRSCSGDCAGRCADDCYGNCSKRCQETCAHESY